MKYPNKPIGHNGKPMTDTAYENLHKRHAEFMIKYGPSLIADEDTQKGA